MSRKRNVNTVGWILLGAGLLSIFLSFFVIQQYLAMKQEDVEGATIWESLGNIYAHAAVGSTLIAMGAGAFLIGIILIFIGLVIIRR